MSVLLSAAVVVLLLPAFASASPIEPSRDLSALTPSMAKGKAPTGIRRGQSKASVVTAADMTPPSPVTWLLMGNTCRYTLPSIYSYNWTNSNSTIEWSREFEFDGHSYVSDTFTTGGSNESSATGTHAIRVSMVNIPSPETYAVSIPWEYSGDLSAYSDFNPYPFIGGGSTSTAQMTLAVGNGLSDQVNHQQVDQKKLVNNLGQFTTLQGHVSGSGTKSYTAEPTNGATYDFGVQTHLLTSDQGPSFTHGRALADFDSPGFYVGALYVDVTFGNLPANYYVSSC
jgi:hypothetical protein